MRIILVCLTLFFLSIDSYGEVLLRCQPTYCDIYIEGVIRPQDLEAFKYIIKSYKQEKGVRFSDGSLRPLGIAKPSVHLNSSGGDVTTALAIGDLMYETQFIATVDLGASCSSSCVFILASSVIRVPVSADINIHRPYSSSTDTSFAQAASDFAKIERIAVYQFKRVGVSTELWDAMMRVPPQTIRQLSIEEIQRFGLQETDPAYQDAMDSRSAKRLGITKQEYFRRKAIFEKCLEDERAKSSNIPPNYAQQYEYCSKRAGLWGIP